MRRTCAEVDARVWVLELLWSRRARLALFSLQHCDRHRPKTTKYDTLRAKLVNLPNIHYSQERKCIRTHGAAATLLPRVPLIVALPLCSLLVRSWFRRTTPTARRQLLTTQHLMVGGSLCQMSAGLPLPVRSWSAVASSHPSQRSALSHEDSLSAPKVPGVLGLLFVTTIH